jgi:hypothetical protein
MRRAFAVGFVLAASGLAATAAADAERLGSLGTWELRADELADGAPYCYAGTDRAPGDRLTFVRSEVGLAVILTRRGWGLPGRALEVDVAVDDHWRDRVEAGVDPRTLVMTWPEPTAVRRALARGAELRVGADAIDPELRWSLAGSTATLAAMEQCWRTRQTTFEAQASQEAAPHDPERRAAAAARR